MNPYSTLKSPACPLDRDEFVNILQDNKIISLISHSEEETVSFGKALGSLLKKGDIIAITGPLGSGKTYLVKGIALGLGIKDSRIVTSPTFTLINEYCEGIPIYHFDAYRLKNTDEMYDLGCDEIFWGDGVTIIEWADKIKECLPDDIIKVDILIDGDFNRCIKIYASGGEMEAIINRLKNLLF